VKNYPPGMIGVACGELGRFSVFTPSIIGMQKPAGTVFFSVTGLGPATPFNEIAREFLRRSELKWLFLTNDDNLCPPDTIPRLLDRLDTPGVDVVTGLYFGRIQPFEPVIFDKVKLEDRNDGAGMRLWYERRYIKNRENGLISIVGCGDGCLMISRRVMEAIPDPWWEYGQTLTDACDHDIVFSTKVRQAGFGLFCDLDIRVDHVAVMTVRPVCINGEWQTHLMQADRFIALPVAHRAEDGNDKS